MRTYFRYLATTGEYTRMSIHLVSSVQVSLSCRPTYSDAMDMASVEWFGMFLKREWIVLSCALVVHPGFISLGDSANLRTVLSMVVLGV